MPHFLVHGKEDNVGVAVQDVKAGQPLEGWNMEAERPVDLKSLSDIPLGHKIALAKMAAGELVIKYNHPIGELKQEVKPGEHVHIHNLKTRRW